MASQIRTEMTEQMKKILSQKRLTRRKKRRSWKKRNWLHSKLPRLVSLTLR